MRCNQCGVVSFVPLPEVGDVPLCPGCRTPQSYTTTADRLQVFYRLNTLVDRASDQGVLPHLLAWAALRRTSADTFILPGVDLTFASGGRAEIDLLGLHGQGVIAGEVKTSSSEFTREGVREDIATSARLGVDIHVMAAVAAIPPERIDEAERLCARRTLRLKVLDAAALRPESTS